MRCSGENRGALAPAAPPVMRPFSGHETECPGRLRVAYEVTHHGPTELGIPSCFVEIGSMETEWRDPAAGKRLHKAFSKRSAVSRRTRSR
jgi:D-aminoacyl-tRNA deacylase